MMESAALKSGTAYDKARCTSSAAPSKAGSKISDLRFTGDAPLMGNIQHFWQESTGKNRSPSIH